MMHLITFALILLVLSALIACADKRGQTQNSEFMFIHESANAVYHWKSTLNPNKYEKNFMKKHHVKRMYVKFFDVGTDNLYDGKGVQPVPIATTIFKDSPKLIENSNIEIVPVVFITVEALRLKQPLVDKMLNRVDAMCKANHIHYREVQVDCDWNKETQSQFFTICKEAKQKLHEKQKGLSATIRLHQLRSELPDVDYGVLMLYNTESLYNPKVKNSIINSQVVAEYMRRAKSNIHLDFAYPTYEWDLWFKDGTFVGILHGNAPSESYIRHERSDFDEIMKAKHNIKQELKDIAYPSATIIYHLDSANLSKYSDYEIEQIYNN